MTATLGNKQDTFTPDSSRKIEEPVYCGVCGEKMSVKRNVSGATSYAMRMANITGVFDLFTCPHSDHLWHKRVILLREEKDKTHGVLVRRLLQIEIDVILESKSIPSEADLLLAVEYWLLK